MRPYVPHVVAVTICAFHLTTGYAKAIIFLSVTGICPYRHIRLMGIARDIIGEWRSLVARFVRDEEAAGSNPVSPTKYYNARVGLKRSNP